MSAWGLSVLLYFGVVFPISGALGKNHQTRLFFMQIIQFLTCAAAMAEDLSIINQTQQNCCNRSSSIPYVLQGNCFKGKKKGKKSGITKGLNLKSWGKKTM